MKIWAKTVLKEKITADLVFQKENVGSLEEFVSALQEICEQMDIPTPLATRTNFNHFVMFNNTRFKSKDFVERVDFDMLDIEAVPEKGDNNR